MVLTKSTLSDARTEAEKTRKFLTNLLIVVEQSGGSYAYMGIAFTKRFAGLPLPAQQILAQATGRFGVSKRKVKRVQRTAEKTLNSELRSLKKLRSTVNLPALNRGIEAVEKLQTETIETIQSALRAL